MKNQFFLLGLAALLVVASCQNPLSQLSKNSASSRTGSITVSFQSQARTIVPNWNSTIASYKVTLTSSNGNPPQTVTVTNGAAATASFPSVTPGTWDINVTALSSANLSVGTGSLSGQTVAAGSALSVMIPVTNSQMGSGNFSFTFTAPSASAASVSATLYNSQGTAVSTFTPAPTAPSAGTNQWNISKTGITSGSYNLQLIFYRSGVVAGVYGEAVNIWDNMTSDQWLDSSGKLNSLRAFASTDFNSSDANLSNLTLATSQGISLTLGSGFSSNVLAYSATSGYSVTFLPVQSIPGQRIQYQLNSAATWTDIGSGTNSPALAVTGTSGTIIIKVTAPDQATTSTYVVTVAPSVGFNAPASGAFSAVNPSTWGSAVWRRGAAFTSGPGSTLNIGVYSANATAILLEVYSNDFETPATHDYWMTQGADNVWRAALAQVPNNTLYAFRAWGPNWPFATAWTRGNCTVGFLSDCDSNGNRFNPNKVLYDPYALEISHNANNATLIASGNSAVIFGTGGSNFGSSQTYSGPITGNVSMDLRAIDTGLYAPKAVALADSTSFGTKPNIPEAETIVYETHLKGLTAHPSSVNLKTLLSGYSGFSDAANVPSNLVGTYAGAAYMAGYLKDLGINTVEFLPMQAFDNDQYPTAGPISSVTYPGAYWGYMTTGYFAPDRSYASNQSLGGPTAEFKQMVAAFHAMGIQVDPYCQSWTAVTYADFLVA